MSDIPKTLREHITDALKDKRAKLSPNSIKTYVSILASLYGKMKGEAGLDFFNTSKTLILDHIKEVPANKRKTLLSALFIITGLDDYHKMMLEDCGQVNKQYKEQKMTTTETDNWVSWAEIEAKYAEYLANVEKMFSKKGVIDGHYIIRFLILALMSGVAGVPPRRSLDYTDMKIKAYDPKTDNYYDSKRGVMVFNKYKTFSTYGQATIDVKSRAPKLNAILKKWVAINPTDYLLYSTNQKKLSSPQIVVLNNSIWGGKKVSVDMYRHIFLTHCYRDNAMPPLTEMEALAHDMGHSIGTALQYIKNDAPKEGPK